MPFFVVVFSTIPAVFALAPEQNIYSKSHQVITRRLRELCFHKTKLTFRKPETEQNKLRTFALLRRGTSVKQTD